MTTTWVHLLAVLTVMFLTGCGTFPDADSADTGSPISQVAAGNLKPGEDTYTQVVSDFGTPLLELDNHRVIAYVWHVPNKTEQWVRLDKNIHGSYRAFALVFNEHQTLQRRAFLSGEDEETLRQRILDWSQAKTPQP